MAIVLNTSLMAYGGAHKLYSRIYQRKPIPAAERSEDEHDGSGWLALVLRASVSERWRPHLPAASMRSIKPPSNSYSKTLPFPLASSLFLLTPPNGHCFASEAQTLIKKENSYFCDQEVYPPTSSHTRICGSVAWGL
jgi:hypothetical protein